MTFSELLEEHKVSLKNKIKEEFPYGQSRYETEGLSEEQTKNFLEFIEENKKNTDYLNCEKPYVEMMKNFLFEQNDSSTHYFEQDCYDAVKEVIKNYFNETIGSEEFEDLYDNATEAELEDYDQFVWDNTEIDYGFESIYNDTKIPEVVIYVSSEYNDVEDAYRELADYEMDGGVLNPENFSTENIDEIAELLGEDNEFPDPINWLIQSQGYEYTDLFDSTKVENSKFLKALNSELCDNTDRIEGSLAFRFQNVSVEDAVNVETSKKNILVPTENVEVGIFDCVSGSATGVMEIPLEKEAVIPRDWAIIARTGKEVGYMPEEVFGSSRDLNNIELKTTDKKPLENKPISREKLEAVAEKREKTIEKYDKLAEKMSGRENWKEMEISVEKEAVPLIRIDDAYSNELENLENAVKKLDSFENVKINYISRGYDLVMDKTEPENSKIDINFTNLPLMEEVSKILEYSEKTETALNIKTERSEDIFIKKGNVNIATKDLYSQGEANWIAKKISGFSKNKISVNGKPLIDNSKKTEQDKEKSLKHVR
jgi:hypothetical protein